MAGGAWDLLAKMVRKDPFVITIAWIALYFFGWFMFPEWWKSNMVSAAFLAFAAMYTLFGLMLPKPKVPFKYTMARKVMTILVILTIFTLWKQNPEMKSWVMGSKDRAMSWWYGPSAQAAPVSYAFPASLAGNQVAETAYRLFMAEPGLTPSQAFEMFEVCREESQQFTDFLGKNADGTPNGAVGPCMIKPEFYGAKAKGLGYADLTKTADNVGMAIWIRKNDPDWEKKWDKLASVRKNSGASPALASVAPLKRSIEVPEGDPENGPWSETLYMPSGNFNLHTDLDDITIMRADGTKATWRHDDPNPPKLGNTAWIRATAPKTGTVSVTPR
jgi:hypothetical protein